MRREKVNYVIQSVAHALDVLEQFADPHTAELGVTELSKRLKLHKNNVFRLLATLESRGYIEQNRATENYRLGIRCLQLGQAYVGNMGFVSQARPGWRSWRDSRARPCTWRCPRRDGARRSRRGERAVDASPPGAPLPPTAPPPVARSSHSSRARTR
jgi:hypothetical protein